MFLRWNHFLRLGVNLNSLSSSSVGLIKILWQYLLALRIILPSKHPISLDHLPSKHSSHFLEHKQQVDQNKQANPEDEWISHQNSCFEVFYLNEVSEAEHVVSDDGQEHFSVQIHFVVEWKQESHCFSWPNQEEDVASHYALDLNSWVVEGQETNEDQNCSTEDEHEVICSLQKVFRFNWLI